MMKYEAVEIEVKDLRIRDKVKFKPTQRKWRNIEELVLLDRSNTTYVKHFDHIIIIHDGCKQVVLHKRSIVTIAKREREPNDEKEFPDLPF